MGVACKAGILVTLGLLLAIAGLVAYLIFPNILQWQVKERLVLSPESETFEHWKDVPVPIFIHFYFFNLTNHEGVWSLTEKPQLAEVGPYVFRESRKKVNVTWNENNNTVSYAQVRTWHFEPDLTLGSLDDIITTLNVPAIAAAQKMKNKMFGLKTIDLLLSKANSTWFIHQPIRKLLFDGYEDIFLKAVKSILPTAQEKFGWFYEKNNTDDGIYTIFTGKDKIENLGRVDMWKGSGTAGAWEGTCDMINGTAGDMWPPFRESKDEKLTVYVSDICRSVSLSFLKETEIKGITAFHYWADNTVLDNGMLDFDNKCFCSSNGTQCLPAGGLNASTCSEGVPIVISYPHFLYADSSYRQLVDGMKPDPEAHQFFIDLEPVSRVPTFSSSILFFQNITSRSFVPIFWFSQVATIDDETAKKLQLITSDLPNYVTVGSFILVILGGIIVTFTFFFAIKIARKRKQGKGKYDGVPMKDY
ncbi:scavenger receptor class B member 1-like [Limulus polyphemus]|uniref:Scavenger receptor class B member 1 n=1 Tax=Limulus polyphemus TaxID=6850 RepID=A0ABM1BLF0_LIMPO|nr:scavenger receptor class B member 1-like [Limulus polyphemus]